MQSLDIAPPPDHVFHAGEFKDAPLHIPVALFYGLQDLRNGNVVSCQAVGIDGDLILLYKAAETRHLGNAGYAFHAQLDDIVLDAAQFGQIVPTRFIDDGVGEPPSETGGIGTENGIDVGGNLVLHSLEVFQDSVPRPVNIGPFLEYHVDKGTAQEGKPPDCLNLRGREQSRCDGIGYLILDEIGTTPRPFRINDHLRIAQVWKGVERCILQGPITPDQG